MLSKGSTRGQQGSGFGVEGVKVDTTRVLSGFYKGSRRVWGLGC